MPWGRRLADQLNAEELATLVSATWDGDRWSIQHGSPNALKSLEVEGLVELQQGVWLLTLQGHRYRRAAPRPNSKGIERV